MIARSVLLIAALGLAGVAPAQTAPAAATEPPIGDLRPFSMPKVERVRLSNGLTLALVPFGSVPQATITVATFAGDVDSDGRPWLAALTADQLKQGAGGRNASQIAEAISSMGGNLTTSADAHLTRLSATVLSERAGDAIGLLAEVLRRPNLAQSDFDRVKANRKRSLSQALASPQQMANTLFDAAMFPGHPYGAPLPSVAQLDAASLADVRGFHGSQFGAARTTVYIVGRFDEAAVKAATQHAFGDWVRGMPRRAMPATPARGPKLILADRPGSEQTTVRIGFDAPATGTAEDIPMRVTDALLGGSFGARITKNIREDKGYTYSPFSYIAARPGNAVWVWHGDITPKVTGAAMTEVFKEIRGLQSMAPAPDEAQGMKTYAATYLLFRTNSADLISGQLIRADLLGLPSDYFSTYVHRALAVTPEQIRSVAQRGFPLDKMTMVVVGDLKTVEPQLLALTELKGIPIQRAMLPKP